MAVLVKWLTHQIVALACVGSIPTYRPIFELYTPLCVEELKVRNRNIMDFFFGDIFQFMIISKKN